MTIWLTPLNHPASILRGAWNVEPAQVTFITRVADLLREGREPPAWDISQPPSALAAKGGGSSGEDREPFALGWPTRHLLYPSLSQLRQWYTELHEGTYNVLSIDIEAAGPHVICVGITPVRWDGVNFALGDHLCLRFRHRGGSRYWQRWDDHLEAVRLLDDLLGDPDLALLFHNGVTYDVPELLRLGFIIRGRLLDTMVMHHEAYKEMPKGLQFLAKLYLGFPLWKVLTSEDDEGEGKA